ncbi:MAG: peptidase MA family metallohydrolase [Thermodesulfobacteriota bacterium]
MKIWIAAGFFLLFSAALAVGADVVYFHDGMRLDVDASWEENGEVCVRMFGTVYRYPRAEIARIEKKAKRPDAGPQAKAASDSQGLAASRQEKRIQPPDVPAAGATDDQATALQLVREGRYRQALETGERAYAASSDPKAASRNMAELHTRYAVHLRKTGMLDKAREQVEAALQYQPEDPALLKMSAGIDLDLAATRFAARDYDAAAGCLQRAARMDPDNHRIYLLHGQIAYAQNEFTDAHYYWRKTLNLDPGNTLAAHYLQRLDQDHQAEKSLAVAESGVFIVKFQGSKRQSVADEAVKILEQARSTVGAALDLYPDEKMVVIVYPPSDLRKLGYLPDWAAGLYDGKIRFPEDLFEGDYVTAILYHEYTHAVVHGLGGPNVPLWLNEGLAEYMARPMKPESLLAERSQLLKSAADSGRLFPLRHLTHLNLSGLSAMNRKSIHLVYAQSESFVTYLIQQYSMVSVRNLVIAAGKDMDLHQAVSRALGGDLDDLEQRWQQTIRE